MNYPKIDLHLHLDGSLSVPWMYQTAIKRGVIPPETTFEEYYGTVYNPRTKHTVESINKFDIPISVLQCEEDLYTGYYNLAKTLAQQGYIYAEIRFAPQLHTWKGMTQTEVVQAICHAQQDALRDFPTLRTGVLCCLMHRPTDTAQSNEPENMETVRVAKEFLGKGVVGCDLAGYENNCDLLDYAPCFQYARELGVPYTMHAGEMGNGANVLAALQMEAQRIGHGICCVNDPSWIQALIDKQIPLEVCVTSNIGDGRNYALHPIRKMIEAGCNVTINCDNMMFSRICLDQEYFMLKQQLGFTDEMIKQCLRNSANAAFCDEETRSWIKAQLD